MAANSLQDLLKTTSSAKPARRCHPLQSYTTTEPEQYIDDIRSRSRILQLEE
jgi:hypothetical protein